MTLELSANRRGSFSPHLHSRMGSMLALLFLLALLVSGFFPATSRAAEVISPPRPAPRVLVQNGGYVLSRFEPSEGCYLGAYVLQDKTIGNDMGRFEELTGRRHVSYFKYVGYGKPAPRAWLEEMRMRGAVPHLAWEPNGGLDAVRDDAYLREFARDLAAASMPVFLRFASEVNGTWMAYHGNPDKFREKWRIVHDVMEAEAPNVMMVWTVFTFPEKTILPYYPGDELVDWVGVNIYSVVYHNNRKSDRADHEDPLRLLDYVYEKFSDRKPIQISEFGATHFTSTDGQAHIGFAETKIRRLYQGLVSAYPRVKSIFYFNVNNLLEGLKGRQINNYAVTDEPRILAAYRELIAGPHFLTVLEPNRAGQTDPEFLLTRQPVIPLKSPADSLFGGEFWVAASDLRGLPGFVLDESSVPAAQAGASGRGLKGGAPVTIGLGSGTLRLPVSAQPTPGQILKRKGGLWLPMRELARGLGLRLEVDPAYQQIRIISPAR